MASPITALCFNHGRLGLNPDTNKSECQCLPYYDPLGNCSKNYYEIWQGAYLPIPIVPFPSSTLSWGLGLRSDCEFRQGQASRVRVRVKVRVRVRGVRVRVRVMVRVRVRVRVKFDHGFVFVLSLIHI